ncbi:MAG: hypothetical protein OEY23_03040 [Acidimicrobiia bacterium]|nr:hypothetical protein [Acidimicrobiia bacterium]
MTVPEPTISVTRGDDRPWLEKWREVLRARDQIALVYAQRVAGLGNAEVDERVTRFCSECHDMRDWLLGDIASLPGVAGAEVIAHATSTPPLVVSSAVANSHKHHTRKAGTTSARIRSTNMTPTGARVSIEIDWATPDARTVDALELADDCISSWRQFLVSRGITEA